MIKDKSVAELSEGKVVRIVAIRKITSRNHSYETHMVWSWDATRLFFLDTTNQILTIYDLRADRSSEHLVKTEFYVRYLKPLHSDAIYLWGISPDETKSHLFRLDVDHAERQPEMILEDVDLFDSDQQGTVIFNRSEMIPEKTSEKTRWKLKLLSAETRDGRQFRIRLLREYIALGDHPFLPVVASDGNSIAYLTRHIEGKNPNITVLQRKNLSKGE
jgi:hypothetical protein